MPAPEMTWQHFTATAGEAGIAGAGAAGGAGETILMGGGWAEYILSDNSNESSTSEVYTDADIPVIGTALEYDSGSNVQTFVMRFRADSYSRMRIHVWIATD